MAAAGSAGRSTSHTVRSGDTLFSLGRRYGVSPFAIADANNLSHDTVLAVGQSIRIPGGGKAAVASSAPDIKKAPVETKAPEQTAEEDTPATSPSVESSASKDQSQIAQNTDAQDNGGPAVDPSLPGFRWPVKGQVISAYGAKPNGLRNEGINISVPEGTSVRAAESGVVAYAGNELKGYGNLVLIRHEGGWVTAYAHNKELFVKRGDTVKRGDVVAKAGQTGSVSSPQVHFEIRKGATAMDPLKFLNNATAAN
jgi:murein DD-endopeptidase MepM/ murein hydrolase activator NlpD